MVLFYKVSRRCFFPVESADGLSYCRPVWAGRAAKPAFGPASAVHTCSLQPGKVRCCENNLTLQLLGWDGTFTAPILYRTSLLSLQLSMTLTHEIESHCERLIAMLEIEETIVGISTFKSDFVTSATSLSREPRTNS